MIDPYKYMWSLISHVNTLGLPSFYDMTLDELVSLYAVTESEMLNWMDENRFNSAAVDWWRTTVQTIRSVLAIKVADKMLEKYNEDR